MNKMAAPTGQHGKYLFWLQLLNRLSDFHTVFTDDLRKRCSLFPDQGDWCHSSPLSIRHFTFDQSQDTRRVVKFKSPRVLDDQKMSKDNQKLRPGCPPDYQLSDQFLLPWTDMYDFFRGEMNLLRALTGTPNVIDLDLCLL